MSSLGKKLIEAATSKPSSTSAAATAFCAAKVEGPGGFLWLDGNGKITAGNGTLDKPKPNAFSLAHISDCPGSTEACRLSCYVHGLKKHAPDTFKLYEHNSRQIRQILADDADGMAWASILALYIAEHCKGGFRWHVSGDVWSAAYARFIVAVCQASPLVNHWIYTRSLEFVPTLRAAVNLTVNVSADRDNYHAARVVAREHGLRLCYMTSDGIVPIGLSDDDVIFPDYALRGGNPEGQAWFEALPPAYKAMVCPVDYHGKSEKRRCGPCDRCLRK